MAGPRKRLSADGLFLIAVMATRKVAEVIQPYVADKGGLSPTQFACLRRLNALHARLMHGDMEATEDEMSEVFAAGQMLAQMAAELNNGQARIIDFHHNNVFGNDVPPQGSYRDVLRALAEGVV